MLKFYSLLEVEEVVLVHGAELAEPAELEMQVEGLLDLIHILVLHQLLME